MLFVNFKTYGEATGKNAVKLAELCKKIAKETGMEIIPVVQAVDVFRVASAVKSVVFCQHADEAGCGQNTGHITVEALKEAGASGTIINHSENRISLQKIKAVVEKCRQNGFKVLVCAKDPKEVSEIAGFEPDYIAYEPPELIGGNISVSTAKPEVIAKSVRNAGAVPLIVGAGIKTAEDVKISVGLGAKGILVASGIVKAKSQEDALKDLIKGFQKN